MTRHPHESSSLYVYGIVRADAVRALSLTGVGTPPNPIGSVVHGDLAALVSAPPARPETTRDDIFAHARALEVAVEETTVLPMRFGMTLASQAAVIDDLLAADYERWAAMLDEFSGTVELVVKAFGDPERWLRRLVEEEPEIRALQGAASLPDRVRLGELVVDALEQRRVAEADRLLGRLSGLARDHQVTPPAIDGMVLDAAFLVERDGVHRFDREVVSLAEETADRLRLRCLGPQPPYTFVTAEAEV